MFGLIILVQSKTNINENCADVSPREYSPSRCIGCTPAKLGQYPWQVALVRRYIGGIIWNFYFCGGILISTELVLTAAHCVTKLNADVILGHIDKKNESQQTIAKGMIKKHFLTFVYLNHHLTYPINNSASAESSTKLSYPDAVNLF